MQLNEFPDAIATLELRIAYQNRAIRLLQSAVDDADRDIEEAIAFDPHLKNDTQRKATKAKLQAVDEYRSLLSQHQEATERRTEIEIELTRLRHAFAVARLEARHATALIEASQEAS